jgi:hypothetical protein
MNTKSRLLLLSVVRQQTTLVRALPHTANQALAAMGRAAECPIIDGEMLLLEARLEAGTRGMLSLLWLALVILAMTPLCLLTLLTSKEPLRKAVASVLSEHPTHEAG